MDIFIKNETSKLKTVIVSSPPKDLTINTKLVDYYGFSSMLDYKKISSEHASLVKILIENHVNVIDINNHMNFNDLEINNKCPNLMYVRDISAVIGNQLFIGNNPESSRVNNFDVAKKIFKRLEIEFEINFDAKFNSEFGDFLILSIEIIAVNIGNRTNYSYLQFIKNKFFEIGFKEILVFRLPKLKEYVHLDMVLNVLPFEGHFIANPLIQNLCVESIKPQMILYSNFNEWVNNNNFNIIYIPENLDNSIALNYFYLSPKKVIVGIDSKFMNDIFYKFKTKVEHISLNEISKGNGGVRCLTLPIYREL